MTTIKLKNGSGAPAGGDLVQGEPALDLTNKRLYTENGSGTVIEVGTNPTSITTGDITATGTGTFTTADNSAQVTLISTDTDALVGPQLNLWRNSGTGTNGDLIGQITFTGEDTVGATNTFATIYGVADQTDNGAEDGSIHFQTLINGVLADRLEINSVGNSVFTGTVTADGLTVNGNANVKSSGGKSTISIGDTAASTYAQLLLYGGATKYNWMAAAQYNADNAFEITPSTATEGVTFSKPAIKIDSNRDISFFEDTGTTAKLVWKSADERLGIGTSSPVAKFDVVMGAGNRLLFTTTGSDTFVSSVNEANNAYSNLFINGAVTKLGTGGTERMRIDASGNVGIGRVSNSVVRLSVAGTDAGASNYAFEATNSSAATRFIVRNDGQSQFFKSDNSASMTVTSGGNVGIGTSSPATALEVNGTIGIGRTAGGYTFRETVGGGERASLKSNASNELLFNIGAASEAMRIDSSGQLLLGRSANVASGAEATRLQFYNTNSTYDIASIRSLVGAGQVNRGELSFAVNNGAGQQERMKLDYSGNLLVGTTNSAPAVSNSEVGVALSGSLGYVAASRSAGASGFFNRLSDGDIVNFNKDGTTVGSIGTDLSRLFIGSDDSMIFFDAGSTNAIWPWKSTATSDGDADNTIDIGDSNNRFKNLYLSGQTLGATGTAGAPAYAFGNDTDMGMYRASNNNLAFSTNGGERMRIDSSGNLLVGCTGQTNDAPNVDGSFKTGGGNFKIRKGTDGWQWFQFYGTGTSAPIGSISNSGNTGVAYNTSSDQRLKENIVNAPSASDDIDAIQVRSFDWKADGSHQKYGMIAQELQTVVPDAVSQGETEEDMMGVDYSKLVPMMLKEIQSLRARVAQLEGET